MIYEVYCYTEPEDIMPVALYFSAEDDDDAREQCYKLHPKASIISVTADHDPVPLP